MGFFSALGSLVSGAISAVSNIASSVGSALAGAAKTALSVAGSFFTPMINIITSIGKMIGVLDKNDTPEDLGRRADLSDKKPEDFDSIKEYIQHLKNDITIDREKIEKESKDKKMAYQAIGATITMKGINEQKGYDIPAEAWASFAKLGLENKEKEVNALLDSFKGEKIKDFIDYVEGCHTPDKEIEVGDRLVETYKSLEPSLSEAEIEKKVMELELSSELKS